MADDNPLVSVGQGILHNAFGGAFWIVVGLIILGTVGYVMYYFFYYKRQFNITVKIRSERAQDPKTMFDKGAILTDRKSKIKYFKLLRTKVELPVPPFTVMEHTNWGDYMEIWRKSEEEFAYLTKPRIEKDIIIKSDGKPYRIAAQKQRTWETDFAWIVKRRADNKKLIDPQNAWAQLLMWMPHIVMSVILLMTFYILWDKLPGILQQLKDLLAGVNQIRTGSTIAA